MPRGIFAPVDNRPRFFGALALLYLGILAMLVGGCVQVGTLGAMSVGEAVSTTRVAQGTQPRLTLLMEAKEAAGAVVQLTLGMVEVSDGGQWQSLLRQPAVISSPQATAGVLLDRAQVAEGRYSKMRCQISAAVLEKDGQRTSLVVPAQAVEFPLSQALDLRAGDSASLFLSWDVALSVAKPPAFTPALSQVGRPAPLTSGLAFVSCPEINTIYLVRVDTNRICGSWGVTGRPTYLKAFKERNLLYVLAADEAQIKVLELSSGQIRDQIRVPMALFPTAMAIDAAGRYAFLLDEKTDTVFRVNLESGTLAGQGRVGEPMGYAVFLEEQQRLAVSAARSNKVFLLDPATLQVQQTIHSGGIPQGLAAVQQNLYLAEGRANAVSLHNLNSGATLRQSVGLGPSRVLLHDRNLFVANAQSGTLAILQPEQLTLRKEIAIGGSPGEMAVSTSRNWLYVVNGKGGVAVVDLTGQRQKARIDLHTPPLDIEVIP